MRLDLTAEINASVDRLGPLPSTDSLDNLTAADKDTLRASLPTEADVQAAWGAAVLAADKTQQRLMIAAQVQVLRGYWDDPKGWCAAALTMARRGNA
jgi:hypothetical protein